MDETQKIDYSKIPKDLQDKLSKWEKNSPANKQLQALTDIADISQEIVSLLDDQKKDSSKDSQRIGALLVDMRESLASLNAKESPETQDYAKPVVSALKELEKSLTTAVKAAKPPVVNVTKADAPVVNVDAPQVNVDLSKVEKILKTDIPAAFNKAIKLIPQTPNTDFSPLEKGLQELSEKLDSIDTGVRMKPQPGTMKVTNLDGTAIGSSSSSQSTSSAVTSTVSVTSSSIAILDTNPSRNGSTIYNESGATAYVKLGTIASITDYTIQMIIGSYYELPFGYKGAISGITSSGTATLRVTELS
jgi:hypothetical protein